VTQAGSSPRQKKKGRAGSYLARFKTLSWLKRERLIPRYMISRFLTFPKVSNIDRFGFPVP